LRAARWTVRDHPRAHHSTSYLFATTRAIPATNSSIRFIQPAHLALVDDKTNIVRTRSWLIAGFFLLLRVMGA
jgi:hypothetical protein